MHRLIVAFLPHRLRLAIYKGIGFEPIADKDGRFTKMLVRAYNFTFFVVGKEPVIMKRRNTLWGYSHCGFYGRKKRVGVHRITVETCQLVTFHMACIFTLSAGVAVVFPHMF